MQGKPSDIPESEMLRLELAVALLEYPKWTAKMVDFIGMPIEWAMERLPKKANQIISKATTKALQKALRVAILTMNKKHRGKPKNWLHSTAVGVSGAAGGLFGYPGATVELPISTTIILRSIADIARSEGEDLASVESQLNCIEVFALGGKSKADDAAETGYFAVRAALAKVISEASEFIAEKGLVVEGAPIIVKLIARIATRFKVVVSEKIATELVPVIGAISGSTINLLFMDHFQAVAKGHFIVRSLERAYGGETISREYVTLAARLRHRA